MVRRLARRLPFCVCPQTAGTRPAREKVEPRPRAESPKAKSKSVTENARPVNEPC